MVAETGLTRTPPKNPVRQPPTRINLTLEMKCRNLYLIRALPASEIATATGLSLKQVKNLVVRRGWAKLKQVREGQIKAASLARMERDSDALQDSIASECEEIAMSGLARAREEVTSDSPFASKNFQAWAGGVRSLASVARTARGQDQIDQKSGAGTVNLFLIGGERVLSPITVSPLKSIELQP